MVTNLGYIYVWSIWITNPASGMRVLDAGAGKCVHILKQCARLGCEIHALDTKPCPAALKKLSNLKFHRTSMLKTKLPADYFDLVFSISVIEHIDPKYHDNVIEELTRILKPGGRLVLSTVEAQKVKNNGPNIAIRQKKLYLVPMNYMSKPKPGLEQIKVGEFIKHPKWSDKSLFWRHNGGAQKNKQWTEYGTAYQKL